MQLRDPEHKHNLKQRSTRLLGVVVADIANSFYSKVIKGIEKVASEQHYCVLVCNTNEEAGKEEEYIRILLQNQVCGVIVATVGADVGLFKPFNDAGIPLVFIDNRPALTASFNIVTIDNVKASRSVTQHLVDQGHCRIAMITGPLNQSTSSERMRGFRECLVENGITPEEKWIGVGAFKREYGYRIMHEWLMGEERPTAVFAANDFLMYGAIKAIYECGLSIPEDIAVACFDANDETGMILPDITAVVQPAYEIGFTAAEVIMRWERDRGRRLYEKVMLEPELLLKGS